MSNYQCFWYDHETPILEIGDFLEMLPEEDDDADEVLAQVHKEALDMLEWCSAANLIRNNGKDASGHYKGAARPFDD